MNHFDSCRSPIPQIREERGKGKKKEVSGSFYLHCRPGGRKEGLGTTTCPAISTCRQTTIFRERRGMVRDAHFVFYQSCGEREEKRELETRRRKKSGNLEKRLFLWESNGIKCRRKRPKRKNAKLLHYLGEDLVLREKRKRGKTRQPRGVGSLFKARKRKGGGPEILVAGQRGGKEGR